MKNPSLTTVLRTAFGDISQFAGLFLLLGICLPLLVALPPLPLLRMLAFGTILGCMKIVARIYSGQWRTHRLIWRRVDSEQWLLPCFLAGLFIAGELSPPTADLGAIQIKPLPNTPIQTPSLTVFFARTSSALSYAITEAKIGLLLLTSLACEVIILSAKRLFLKRSDRHSSPD